MLTSYFKIFIRNLARQKGFGFINISGLAAGLVCAILIMMWVRNELRYDAFHQNENIYRITSEWKENDQVTARTPGKLGPAALAEIPEIVRMARIMQNSKSAYHYGDKMFYEEKSVLVDPEFFEIFSFPVIQGDAENPLPDTEAIILNEAVKQKYFGDENALGKTLNWNNWRDFRVSAVVENPPPTSTLKFDFYITHEGTKRSWPGGYTWGNAIHETYVQIQPGADIGAVEEKMNALVMKHAPQMEPYLKRFGLQPLSDVHLNAEIVSGIGDTGDRRYIYVFSIIAAFILLIACFNFMNLSTAKAMQRAKEVGLRKTVGAKRTQLIFQFFGESLLLSFIAFLFAMIIVEMTLPYFNVLVDKELQVVWFDGGLVTGFLALTLLTGFIAGSYPALYLSGFNPIKTTQGGLSLTGGRRFRNILVTVQFSLSILLIIGALAVQSQLDFMRTKNLGFEKENVVYFPAKGQIGSQFNAVKSALLSRSGVSGVTLKGSLPMNAINNSNLIWPGKDPNVEYVMENAAVDYDFMEFFSLNLLEGRGFSQKYPSDAHDAFVINETAANVIGREKALGQRISIQGKDGVVIGVVQDAHFQSLHHKIGGQVFYILRDYTTAIIDLYGVVMVKIGGQNVPHTLAEIEGVWRDFNPNAPFQYHFLDETIDRQYVFEKKISTIAGNFTLLAIFISCLGLLGLSAYSAERRTKEIGVRKVLGARAISIASSFVREFGLLIIIANVFAWPVAWLALQNWLAGFAYRAELSFWNFALAGASALVIAILTISYQAIKVSLANPVNALKCE